MAEPPREPEKPSVEATRENPTNLAMTENEQSFADRDAPLMEAPLPHPLRPDEPTEQKAAATSRQTPKLSTEASVAVDVLSNSFAPPPSSGRNYHPSFSTNRFATAPDLGLIMQPLITTPAGMQLSSHLSDRSHSDYRHGFTPRPFGLQGSRHPGHQSSVITNRTYSNTPRHPFAHRMLPMQRSTSSNRTFTDSSTSVFGNPTSQERIPYYNLAGFTPMMQLPPSTQGIKQQMPTPSPLVPLSSQQMATMGYAQLPQNATTPRHPFVQSKKTVEALVKANKRQTKKKRATKPKASKPAGRSRPDVDASTVMTLDLSTRACNCPKNQCIKLYCECFHRGQICDPSQCNCTNCLNTANESGPTGARTKKVKDLLSRKGTDAFKVKPKKTGVGCMCKKSRYVECFCVCDFVISSVSFHVLATSHYRVFSLTIVVASRNTATASLSDDSAIQKSASARIARTLTSTSRPSPQLRVSPRKTFRQPPTLRQC